MKKVLIEEFCELCPNPLHLRGDTRPRGRLFLKEYGQEMAISMSLCQECYTKMLTHFFNPTVTHSEPPPVEE